jgi:hypothetical protein
VATLKQAPAQLKSPTPPGTTGREVGAGGAGGSTVATTRT